MLSVLEGGKLSTGNVTKTSVIRMTGNRGRLQCLLLLLLLNVHAAGVD